VPTFQYRLRNPREPMTVADYRELARRKVPDMVWAYVDYGAEDLVTLQANRSAFDRYRLRTKVLSGNKADDLSAQVAGEPVSFPVLLGPVGLLGLAHHTGERGAAQAAERAGTLSVVSTSASYSFEEVSGATDRPHFFQLYPWADLNSGRHDLTLSLMQRAQRAGFRAMFVTVDVPTQGNRESERRRGMGKPPVITPARVLDAARRPAWWTTFLLHQRISQRNLVDGGGGRAAMRSLDKAYTMMRPELDWSDFSWMRDHWDGPLYVKGILDADDAARAVDLGADGVVVSNHGGRQLDGAVASLDALPAVVARVGERAEVLLDGGIRRGTDVVKALCLGATAVLIGRPYVYGLAARGPAGVEHVLGILHEEVRRAMVLMGVNSVKELTPDRLAPADEVLR
jgi:L-lactate dehydrogenase (cytochrome)/(S)-mandelate dehydrogenase